MGASEWPKWTVDRAGRGWAKPDRAESGGTYPFCVLSVNKAVLHAQVEQLPLQEKQLPLQDWQLSLLERQLPRLEGQLPLPFQGQLPFQEGQLPLQKRQLPLQEGGPFSFHDEGHVPLLA